MCCHSVICHRVSSKQKAEVVKLAQDNGKNVVLAVGDGANDVPMIHVSYHKNISSFFYLYKLIIYCHRRQMLELAYMVKKVCKL